MFVLQMLCIDDNMLIPTKNTVKYEFFVFIRLQSPYSFIYIMYNDIYVLEWNKDYIGTLYAFMRN